MLSIRAEIKGKRTGSGRRTMCMIAYPSSVRILSDKEVAFVSVQV